MAKQIDAAEAVRMIPDGATLMIGGFMSNGTPEILMDALVEKGIKNLTVIANDAGTTGTGIGKLIAAGAVRKIVASHIGLNPMAGQMMGEGKLEVDLVPQGTLIEQIRAGGAGLGGVLTPTGLGTDVAVGKKVVRIDGRDFLLEKPMRADFALLRGSIADEGGNVFYKGTTRNFNPVIAMAADVVICAAEQLVPQGEIPAESVATPGIFVDYIVGGEPA
jgi:acetate CoA/acetoacetate CoA-transferase alpha subunit